MLFAAITFFVLALVAYALGENSIAGFSADAGKLLLYVFVVLSVISLVVNLIRSGTNRPTKG